MQTLRMPGLPELPRKSLLAIRCCPGSMHLRSERSCSRIGQSDCEVHPDAADASLQNPSMRAALLQHVSWSSHLLHLFQGPSPPLPHAQMSRHPQDISETA